MCLVLKVFPWNICLPGYKQVILVLVLLFSTRKHFLAGLYILNIFHPVATIKLCFSETQNLILCKLLSDKCKCIHQKGDEKWVETGSPGGKVYQKSVSILQINTYYFVCFCIFVHTEVCISASMCVRGKAPWLSPRRGRCPWSSPSPPLTGSAAVPWGSEQLCRLWFPFLMRAQKFLSHLHSSQL